jgi:CBS-domain-containing membrane protein
MIFKMSIKELLKIIGAVSHGTGHTEKFISAASSFIGIALTMWVSTHYLGMLGAVLIVASMGASAVLLFAVPHSPLAQPWPLIGGHTTAALIGVSCAQLIPNPLLAAPLCVALTIITMHYLRCLHPPGGGTALAAVIGGSEVHALGYQFVLTPVLLNATILLCTAIIVNYAFPWRRYPAYFKKRLTKNRMQKIGALNHDDFEYAIKEIDSFIDIDEDDLVRIYKLALEHSQRASDQPTE